MPSVSLIAYADVDDLDFCGALSVLAKASAAIGKSAISVNIVSEERSFRTSSGICFDAQDHWSPLKSAGFSDAIVVPGGAGAAVASQSAMFDSFFVEARAAGSQFYTICSGALLLAGSGLLRNRHVAMHHTKHDLLRGAGCDKITSGLVKDTWLTSVGGDKAPSCKSLDITFELIKDLSPAVAAQVAARMELSGGRKTKTLAGVSA